MSPTTPYPGSESFRPPPAQPPLPAPDTDPQPAARAVSWQGISTVLVLELRQRVRSTRWKVALGAFFAIVGLITLLLFGVFDNPGMDEGQTVYELILLFVLGLGLLVTPTLASTAINGDRNAGTLAIMQITKLSAADLAVGKLLASWIASLAFLAVSAPFLIWTWLLSGFSAVVFVRGVVVLAVLLAVVCAFSLGFSALTNRTAGSSVLSYLTVGTTTVICLILFALSVPLVTDEAEVQVYRTSPTNSTVQCEWVTETMTVSHTDRTWWLLVINPFVILADAASPEDTEPQYFGGPLDAIRGAVRFAREGPSYEQDRCWSGNYGPDAPEEEEPSQEWFFHWGLGLNTLIGAGGLAFAIKRLSVPYKKLPKGARVA